VVVTFHITCVLLNGPKTRIILYKVLKGVKGALSVLTSAPGSLTRFALKSVRSTLTSVQAIKPRIIYTLVRHIQKFYSTGFICLCRLAEYIFRDRKDRKILTCIPNLLITELYTKMCIYRIVGNVYHYHIIRMTSFRLECQNVVHVSS